MQEIIHLVNEMSPYLLLGFFLAGLMHAFVPRTLYSRYLSARGFRSVLYAALLGIPLPLCSCGVIPTAMSLRREGASKGAAVSFLIATPQTGVDSIVATYSLLGLPFALIRPVVALITALGGGWLVDWFDDSAATAPSGGLAPSSASQKSGISSASSLSGESTAASAEPSRFLSRMVEALRYAFVEMMQDIGKWLLIGLVVAGAITILVPDEFFALFAGNSLMSMLFVLLFSLPMYLCATGSIPIAVALMLKGLTPGAALVLLMAGPASNAASILVINKVLGRRSMLLYILSIVGGAILFGLGIDAFLPAEWFLLPSAVASADCCGSPSSELFGALCTVVLFLLLAHAFARQYLGHESHCHCHEGHESHCHCHEAHGSGHHPEREGHEDVACAHEGSAQGHDKSVHAHDGEQPQRVYRYRVEGMNCNHCRTNVERAIRSIAGVHDVEVSLSAKEARVEGEFDEDQLMEAVRQLGFEIRPL